MGTATDRGSVALVIVSVLAAAAGYVYLRDQLDKITRLKIPTWPRRLLSNQ